MGIVYEKLSSIFTTELHDRFPEPEYSIHNIPTFEDMYKVVLRFSSTATMILSIIRKHV